MPPPADAPVGIGFVGAGEMGAPMVERLLAAGHRVAFCSRRPEVAAPLAERGGIHRPSVAAAATDADVVIVCVYDDAQVEAVTLGADGVVAAMAPGSTLVVHTTGAPALVRRIAETAAARDVRVVDAPVSGGPGAVRDGTLVLFVGGDAADVDRCRPVLAAYADPVLHVGPLGAGQQTKLVNNLLFAAHIALVRDATRMLDELGVPAAPTLAAVARGSGDSQVVRMAHQLGSIDVLLAAAGRFIAKDVATALAVAAGEGVDAGALGDAALRAASTGTAQPGSAAPAPSAPLTPQQLWDIECIEQLKARYFRFLDTRAWDDFADLFTDDCVHHLPDGSGRSVDNAEYFPMLQATLVPGVTVHHGHMPEITLLGPTEAEAVWSMFDFVQTEPASGPISLQGYGHYIESYRKCADGRWRISAKRNERLRVDLL